MAYNQYDLNALSLVKTGILSEMYIPLWYLSSGYLNIAGVTTAGNSFVPKGSSQYVTGSTSTQVKLHTLNSNWSATQKFALEASIWSASATCYLALWDMNSNTVVSGSTISTTSTTATVVRSSQFTLTPGHTYGISIYSNSSSGNNFVSKASLIAFLS